MENLQEIGSLLLAGFGLLVAFVFLALVAVASVNVFGLLSGWIELQRKRLARKLAELDTNPALLSFGNSYEGKWANQRLQSLKSHVDEPTDPIYQAAFKLPIIKQAWQAGILSPEAASRAFAEAVETAVKLTDGIPNLVVDVVPEEGALPAG